MQVDLAYGRGRLTIDLPSDRTTVLEPTYVPGLPDQAQAVRDALRAPTGTPPLRSLVRRGQTVAIAICDGTRPMPSHTVLPVVLEELSEIQPAARRRSRRNRHSPSNHWGRTPADGRRGGHEPGSNH